MSSTAGNEPTPQHPTPQDLTPTPTGEPVVPAADQPTGSPVTPATAGAPGYGTTPPESDFPQPVEGPDGGFPPPGGAAPEGAPEDDESTKLNVSLIVSVVVAGLVVAAAFLGVVWYRHHTDQQDTKTEAAFTKTVEAQSATVETVECHGDTCAAVIGGTAYSVLVQKDADGNQHFGVSAYTGD